ncbi:MAG: hypothetical protein LBR87_00615 [Synergistaceae bacterium]|jgi:hypothetical protein|nr:hypothetical protein [Synergistaceae bacterium]
MTNGERFLAAFLISAGLFCSDLRAASAVPEISFEYEDGASFDLSSALELPSYTEIDAERYGASAGRYMLQEMTVRLTSGDDYRLMLTCSSIDRDGGRRGIMAVIADERRTPAAMIQKVPLGDGYAPQILTPSADWPGDVMFRAIRAGDDTEAKVYSINPVTGRIAETISVTRAFPERMKLNVKGLMTDGGVIEIEYGASLKAAVDMSGMLDALVDDGLYQPDGRPIPALVNLSMFRGGWEDESLYVLDGVLLMDVGFSLVSLSEKPVVTATAVLAKGQDDSWSVREFRFEPALPYRVE